MLISICANYRCTCEEREPSFHGDFDTIPRPSVDWNPTHFARSTQHPFHVIVLSSKFIDVVIILGAGDDENVLNLVHVSWIQFYNVTSTITL